MVSKEDFNKVWKDSSREDILNQFYYEHYELFRIKKEVREYVENENIDVCTIRYNDIQDVKQELLEILDKGKSNEKDK